MSFRFVKMRLNYLIGFNLTQIEVISIMRSHENEFRSMLKLIALAFAEEQSVGKYYTCVIDQTRFASY